MPELQPQKEKIDISTLEMESLGEYVRKSVFEKYKVSLDWEVIRVGRKKD